MAITAKNESLESEKKGAANKKGNGLEIKKRFAGMPASIVFIPVGGKSGFMFQRLLLDLNKYVRKINNSAVFGDILEIRAKHERISKLVNDVWNDLKDIAPRFHAFDPRRWQDINETMEERLRLINRAAACVINPIDDNVAELTMAIKILSEKFNEYQAKSDFDALQQIALLFRKIQSELTAIMGEGNVKTENGSDGSNT